MTQRPRRRLVIIGAIAIVVLAVGGYFGYRMLRPAPERAGGPGGIPTAMVSKGSVIDTVSAAANLRSARTAGVDFATSGTVTQVFVKLGDSVAKGQKLGVLDDRQAKRQVDAAKANLASAKQALADAKAAHAAAPPEPKPPTAPITSATAQVKEAEYRVEQAEEAVRATTLVAPFGGTVTAMPGAVGYRSGGTGTAASPNAAPAGGGESSPGPSGRKPVPPVDSGAGAGGSGAAGGGFLTLTDLNSYQIGATFSEIDIVKVKAGQLATVAVNALGGKKFPAKVTQVDMVPMSSSGVVQYGVMLELTETVAELKPGQSANVMVTVAKAENVLLAPSGAVRTVDGQSMISVLENGMPKQQQVQTGVRSDHQIEIVSGVKEGTQVVMSDSGGPGRFPEGGFPDGKSSGGGVVVGGK